MSASDKPSSNDRFIGVNKFCDAIQELTQNHLQIGVYFTDYTRSKFYNNEICIKPIGFYLVNSEMKTKYLRYYDVHKYLPNMEYIKFKENCNRKLDDSNKEERSLHRLIIVVEESVANDIKYHQSKIVDCNSDKLESIVEKYKEDRKKIITEMAYSIEDDFDAIDDEDLEID